MMKKISRVNDKDLMKIALDEAKAITEEDVKFCQNMSIHHVLFVK